MKNYLTSIINHTVADPERCLPCSGKAKVIRLDNPTIFWIAGLLGVILSFENLF